MLRYFNAFGPRQRPDMAFTRIALALRDGTPFTVFGDGDQSRGWTYVGDVVAATLAATEQGSGVYNVGGALEASLNETIAVFERISGRTLRRIEEPAVPGDQRRTQADTTRIERELGWRPQVGLEAGLSAQWKWASARVLSQLSAAHSKSRSRCRAGDRPASLAGCAFLARRWFVVAGLVVGVVIGGLYSLSGGSTYQATVTIQPAQPFTPSGTAVLNYSSSSFRWRSRIL